MAIDPICGMYVEESDSSLHAKVRGTTYYFCSESCMREFVSPELELRSIRRSLVLSVILGVPILLLSYLPIAGTVPLGWVLLALATPVQFIAGWRFYRGTWNAIKMRSSNMDVLIAIGTSAAYFYSLLYVLFPQRFSFGGLYFDTSAIIIAFLLMGRLLEHTVRGRASDAIRKLAQLQPKIALVIGEDGTTEREVPVEQLNEGDIFVVKPGQGIATDGVVIDGDSPVDEKMITGESIPIEKTSGAHVIGGTINGTGRVNVDYAVIQTLEEIGRVKGKRYGFTDGYEVEITQDTAKLLLDKIRFNLSLEEIIANGRILAKYMLGQTTAKNLSFSLKLVEVRRKDTLQAKELILGKSHRELGMNKSTVWYMKKRLERTGAIRIYNKTSIQLEQ